MAETGVTGGESAAEPTGTTVTETSGQTEGQSAAPDQTASTGTNQSGESFFDYESIKGKPELEAAYKEMQRAFSRKTEEMSKAREKIAQYDQFMANPEASMRQLAQQYGYQMIQGQAQDNAGAPKTYNNWDEVREDFKQTIRAEVMEELNPLLGEVQSMKKQNVEQMLDNNYPDWRTYEDEMMGNLRSHPTLVNNPDLLYRMSIPPEVLEARANKRALMKIQGAAESGTIQGQSTTTQQTTKKPGKMTFDQAVAFARQEVKRQGLAPPVGE